jgi:hypothetical protein
VTWTFIWLMFLLKIPIGGLLWIVWWAIHQTDGQAADGGDGGTKVHAHRTPLPRPPRPRRGTHAAIPPPAPSRVRCGALRTLAVGCPVSNRPAQPRTVSPGSRGGAARNEGSS